MRLIIDIPEQLYEIAKDDLIMGGDLPVIAEAIKNGTPVEERPQSEWIVISREDCNTFLNPIYKCPFCGEVYAVKKPYCTCGAKMMKGEVGI